MDLFLVRKLLYLYSSLKNIFLIKFLLFIINIEQKTMTIDQTDYIFTS